MPDVVYAVHKFEAENVDEISLNIGEKVVILEKDEGYNDGWWQGRNEKGEVGLFPITYTSKAPPPSLSKSTGLETKIDSLENTISKMKTPQQHKSSGSISSMASIPSKNIQTIVNQSVNSDPQLNDTLIEEWTSDQVAAWLLSIGFEEELADNFKDQEITGDILLELTLDSLKELQVKTFGKRFKIHNAINALRQESKIQKNKNQVRAISPTMEKPISNNTLASYYNSNKQQQPYVDDDLVSDYSTVIRNSQIVNKPINTNPIYNSPKPAPSSPPERPSIPLDMDLIATSPRLSTLVENNINDGKIRQQQQQQQQQRVYQQQQQNHFQRPMSHQHPLNNNSVMNDWKRNTVNPVKTDQGYMETEGRISTSSHRYSFMRSSLLPTSQKLHSILPNSSPHHQQMRKLEELNNLSEVPDMEGWLYKQGDRYKNWNKRWFVLKANNLFYFKNPKAVRMKGIINLKGYRIEVDESIHPGKYCFMAQHERERTFYFYTEHEKSMKDWLKALMKATIARDYATPVMSSSTIPTVSLEQARKMRPRPPSTIFSAQQQQQLKDSLRAPTPLNFGPQQHQLNQHFSLMSIDEKAQPIMTFSHQTPPSIHEIPSRSPSVMSQRQLQQPMMDVDPHMNRRYIPDNASEYSIDQRSNKLKDSGFTSGLGGGGSLSRSVTESSGHSSSGNQSSIKNMSMRMYPKEEDEDLIDPEHMNPRQQEIAEKQFVRSREEGYVDWINSLMQPENKIKFLSDLSNGKVLVEFLENLSNKEIAKSTIALNQSLNAQNMDYIISAYKFMSLEGIELDGACTIRDVANGNETKIMHLLDAVEYWYKSIVHSSNGKKMASGGTFGEEDQYKLREIEEAA